MSTTNGLIFEWFLKPVEHGELGEPVEHGELGEPVE